MVAHQAKRRVTLLNDCLDDGRRRLEASKRVAFPNARWRNDIPGFAAEVLGMRLTPQQCALAEAVCTSPQVACRAGQKLGKTEGAAAIILWYLSTFPEARVTIIASTDDQMNRTIWRAVRKLHAQSGRLGLNDIRTRLIPLEGCPATLAATGLRLPDLREVIGQAPRTTVAAGGISGPQMLYVVDEASDVRNEIIDAVRGNLSAGLDCKLLLTGNPTSANGFFADVFLDARTSVGWQLVHMSHMANPNYLAKREVVPGLASYQWVLDRLEEFGPESPFYKVRVLGEFVRGEAGRVIAYDLIAAAEARWEAAAATGVLQIGLDPAGEGDDGDETAFVVRRGSKMLCAPRCYRGLTSESIWEHLKGLMYEFRTPGETPIVKLDAAGAVGEPLCTKLIGISNTIGADPARCFAVIPVRANRPARRGDMYGTIRDELWANLANWLREGGAIATDSKLERELNAPSWFQHTKGVSKVTPKDDIRKVLGRSPDRCDALALAVWEPTSGQLDAAMPEEPVDDWDEIRDPYDQHHSEIAAMNPYAAIDEWERKR